MLSRLPLVLKGGDGWVVPVAVPLGLAGDATVPSMCFLDTLWGLASEHTNTQDGHVSWFRTQRVESSWMPERKIEFVQKLIHQIQLCGRLRSNIGAHGGGDRF